MVFEELRVKNVRNINNITLLPCKKLNIIHGANASGKTALLEAVFVLSRARSFRTPRIREVIQHRQPALQVSADINNGSGNFLATGIEKAYGKTTIKYAGAPVKTVSEQARNIPLVVITPDSHRLVSGTPRERRHWLDWAMFHVEHAYIQYWKDYQRALRNRNKLLKQAGTPQQLGAWETALYESSERLKEMRRAFLRDLQQSLRQGAAGIDFTNLDMEFNSGDPGDASLADYLARSREEDRRLGYTKYGAHRADIRFSSGDQAIADLFSRGQIKRFVIALQLAMASTFALHNNNFPVILVDDYAAELDTHSQQDLLAWLTEYEGQAFLTTTEIKGKLGQLAGIAMFHVEHGSFNKMVK